jgi:hypothetical protein
MRKLDSVATFLSYATADRKVAEKLREELERQGVPLLWWDDSTLAPGSRWRDTIEDAIRSANAILVLAGPRSEPDEWQQFTWRAALETVWEDSGKRIVPILLGDAKVPTFVYSADVPFQAVRIDDPSDLEEPARAVAAILSQQRKTAKEEARPRGTGSSTGPQQGALSFEADDTVSGSGSPPVKDARGMTGRGRSVPADVEAERTARLSEIRRYAELLKASR